MNENEVLQNLEESVNAGARLFAQKEYGIPARAIQVILQPGADFICVIERGPTAIIRLGVLPNHIDFTRTLKQAIHRVYESKMWESLEIERVSDILERGNRIRDELWKVKKFNPEKMRGMPREADMHVKIVTRVEAYHHPTKLREVVEFEHGSILAAKKLAEARLARRIMELDNPFSLPVDDENWIALTN